MSGAHRDAFYAELLPVLVMRALQPQITDPCIRALPSIEPATWVAKRQPGYVVYPGGWLVPQGRHWHNLAS